MTISTASDSITGRYGGVVTAPLARPLKVGDRIPHVNDPRKIGTIVDVSGDPVAIWPHLELGSYRESVIPIDVRVVVSEPTFTPGDRVENYGRAGEVIDTLAVEDGGFVMVLLDGTSRPRKAYPTLVRRIESKSTEHKETDR